jgi:hypothetical protein
MHVFCEANGAKAQRAPGVQHWLAVVHVSPLVWQRSMQAPLLQTMNCPHVRPSDVGTYLHVEVDASQMVSMQSICGQVVEPHVVL